MRQYPDEPFEDQDNRQTKLPQQAPSLPKYGEVKRSFDFLITTPGKLRRGVARNGDALRGFTDYNTMITSSIQYVKTWRC